MSTFRIQTALIAVLIASSACEKPFEKTAPTLFQKKTSAETGISFSNTLEENNSLNYMFYQSIYNGAGVAVADLDNDGLEDIFFTGNQVANRLYKNLGGLKFEDQSAQAGIIEDEAWSTGVAIADVDGNGFKDIYISNFLLENQTLRSNKLYMNQGNMQFIEQAESMGVADEGYTIQSAFLDYDQDGDLDLYLANQPPNHSSRRIALKDSIDYRYTDKLYRNDGQSFTEVTADAGITNYAYSLTAITSDLNDDGWPDIYVTCDFDEPDLIYINQKDGTFKEQSHDLLQHMSNFSMGADIADFNNDGLLDIYTADMVAEDNKRLKTNMSGMNPKKFYGLVDKGFHHQYMFNALQLNRGEGHFSEIAQLAGVSATDWSWTALFQDFDSDGNKDLLVTNGLKRDVRDNDFNIARKKKVRKLQAEAQEKGETGVSINPLELLALSPSTPIQNYMFHNNGDLTFEKITDEWGLGDKLTSHGTAYADLDNDGDMDLVMNNMDEMAVIYENKRECYVDNHWLQIELKAPIIEGTQVKIFSDSGIQLQECVPVRGYMSTSTSILQFGLGGTSHIDSLIVRWPDGNRQLLHSIPSDQRLLINKHAESPAQPLNVAEPLFKELALIDYRHQENEFDDFLTEILIPHRMSTTGPCMCSGDVNGDGLEDVYIGGALDQDGKLFLQTEHGFDQGSTLSGAGNYEDSGCAIFDANGDGQPDLYVVSGGNEIRELDSRAYQDRLYTNQGEGNLVYAPTALPDFSISGSCVKPYDIDADGDLDLFVGGRQSPGKYPFPVDSKILVNENGTFIDKTEEIALDFKALGMVTDALWHDPDQDGNLNLTIVGEWMPISYFEMDDGKLVSRGVQTNSTGWWNTIASLDADGDGDEDLVAGNLGLNIKYKASAEEPFQIFSADFDENGSNDIYLAYYQEGNCFPVRGRQCSSQQLPFVLDKFPNYNDFGDATVYEVLGEDTTGALNYKATEFRSMLLINEAGNYQMEPLPIEAQFSVVNSVIHQDLNRDGILDLYLAGNLYDREVETTRSDASYGVYMQGRISGGFTVKPLSELGVYLGSDVRKLAWVKGKKKNLIIAAINNDQVRIFAEDQVNE